MPRAGPHAIELALQQLTIGIGLPPPAAGGEQQKLEPNGATGRHSPATTIEAGNLGCDRFSSKNRCFASKVFAYEKCGLRSPGRFAFEQRIDGHRMPGGLRCWISQRDDLVGNESVPKDIQ